MARRPPYVPIPVRRLGIMLRLHRRHKYIPRIFDNIKKLARSCICGVSVMLDRPTADVVCALDKELKFLPTNIAVALTEASMPLVDRGENFMLLLQQHYAHLLDNLGPVDAVCLWDDDFWFRRRGIRELRGHLSTLNYDRVEARSWFLWDHPEQANERFRPHWQAILFRVYPGDDFPLDYIVHCPHRVARSPHVCRMRNRLHNAGYLEKDERLATFEVYRRAGKIDAFTTMLVADPIIQKLTDAD